MHSQSRRVPTRPLAAPLQQHQQTSSVRSALRQGLGGNAALPSPSQDLSSGGPIGSPAGRKTPKSASKSITTNHEDLNRLHPSPNAAVVPGKGATPMIITTTTTSSSNHTAHGNKEAASKEYLDYTNTTFPPLEPPSEITFEKYCGPTPESNWVVRDKLLVGAYPASQSDMETFELLISILKLGVTSFVCLQQEYRIHGVTEAMWRSGQALRPYFEDAKVIVKNKAMFKSLADHSNVVDLEALDFVHFPIKDCSITDDAAVLRLAQSLVARLHRGERLYVHCWGGHGRTGTVICIMLHLMYGLDAQSAMNYCQYVHDLRQCHVEVGSPQTETQRMQVRRVIAALTQHRLSAHIYMQMHQLELEASINSPRVDSDSTTSVSRVEEVDGTDAAKKTEMLALPPLVQAVREVDATASKVQAPSVADSGGDSVVPTAPSSPAPSSCALQVPAAATRGRSRQGGRRGVSYISATSSLAVSSSPSCNGSGGCAPETMIVAHRSSKSELVIVQQQHDSEDDGQDSAQSAPESMVTTQVSMQTTTTECEYIAPPSAVSGETGSLPQRIIQQHTTSLSSMKVTSPSQSALSNHDVSLDTGTSDTVFVETTAERLRVDAIAATQKSDAIVHSHYPLGPQPLALVVEPSICNEESAMAPATSPRSSSSPFTGRRASNATLVKAGSKNANTVHMELQIPRVVVNEPPSQFMEEHAATYSELASMISNPASGACDLSGNFSSQLDDNDKLSTCNQNTASCGLGGVPDRISSLHKLGGGGAGVAIMTETPSVTKSQDGQDTETEGEEDDEDARTEDLSNASVSSETAAEREEANVSTTRCWPRTLRPQPPKTPRSSSRSRSSKAAPPGSSAEEMSRCHNFSLLACIKSK